jgi:hypothetical protein
MKRAFFFYIIAIFALLFISNCSKSHSKTDTVNGQGKFIPSGIGDFVNYLNNHNNTNEELVNEEIISGEGIVEIFKLDKINIILEKNTNITRYLPTEETILKLTNKKIFEYNYRFTTDDERFYKENVKIGGDIRYNFYGYEASIGGAAESKLSFDYVNDHIIMHFEYDEVSLEGWTEEESEEELEKRRQNAKKAQFDAIFKKVITKKEKISQAKGIINSTGVRLRTEPEITSEIIFNLDDRESIEIIGISERKQKIAEIEDYWYEVRIKYKKIFGDERDYDIEGWIFGAYIDVNNRDFLEEKLLKQKRQ